MDGRKENILSSIIRNCWKLVGQGDTRLTVSASARLTAAVTTVDPEERRRIEMDRMIERHRKKELVQGQILSRKIQILSLFEVLLSPIDFVKHR